MNCIKRTHSVQTMDFSERFNKLGFKDIYKLNGWKNLSFTN